MKTFQDVATFYFRATPETEKMLVNRAVQFPYVIVADAYLVHGYEMEPMKTLTVFADRKNRRDMFDPGVLALIDIIAKDGPQSIFTVVNGVPSVWEAGKDYEPSSAPVQPQGSGSGS